jgi:hypothetical protein
VSVEFVCLSQLGFVLTRAHHRGRLEAHIRTVKEATMHADIAISRVDSLVRPS